MFFCRRSFSYAAPRRPASRRQLRSPGLLCIVCLAALSACLDTLNASRTDSPPALLRVADSLGAEHFGGSLHVEQPRPDVLRLTIRDPGRCGNWSPPLRAYASDASYRALALFRPRPSADRTPAPIREVIVRFRRTHRFGALTWTTSLGSFTFDATALRALPPPAPMQCAERIPSLLRLAPDST
jgi:hypothetical protein